MLHFNWSNVFHTESITNIVLSILFLHSAWVDARKYLIQKNKIRESGTSKNVSRRFTNDALYADFIKLLYVTKIVQDLYIVLVTIVALICVGTMWYWQYMTYPYKKRGLNNFRRPSIYAYLINSLLPNDTRPRL